MSIYVQSKCVTLPNSKVMLPFVMVDVAANSEITLMNEGCGISGEDVA